MEREGAATLPEGEAGMEREDAATLPEGEAGTPDEARPQAGSAPFLPASFFSKLVHQPKCITEGVCNNCGRCEH